jgi:bifunctional N-acetylglucosamine-1-phosphate-uridyltransferase/glucosamine-1-phosphate-acetyltransferase GlmU-like protein
VTLERGTNHAALWVSPFGDKVNTAPPPLPLDDGGEPTADIRDVQVHPAALCESAEVGPGTRVGPFTHVRAGATVGSGCTLGSGICVDGGAVLGDRVTVKDGVVLSCAVTIEDDVVLGPGVVFTDDQAPGRTHYGPPKTILPTIVRRGAIVGGGSVVISGVVIGAQAYVEPGTVVNRNVPDHAIILGSSAHRVGWVCRCGRRLPDTLRCPACRRGYRLGRSGLRALSG